MFVHIRFFFLVTISTIGLKYNIKYFHKTGMIISVLYCYEITIKISPLFLRADLGFTTH